ncbi:MAG TPA: ATP-binding protein, partial [Patescibacteria group bacterium]|nr:ATP-binding protein [Patescibacteria group bacterium]
EFSAFARMPAPVVRDEDLLDVVRQTVFLARNGYPDVTVEADLPNQPLKIPCDVRQVGQALTNLVKNAVEAVQGREDGDLPRGLVQVSLSRHQGTVTIAVTDNGKGLPEEQRDRLTEPYVTTRVKGTGLGLAIVKKIMEDHGGELVLEDLNGAGARVSLVFRSPPNSGGSGTTETVSTHGA